MAWGNNGVVSLHLAKVDFIRVDKLDSFVDFPLRRGIDVLGGGHLGCKGLGKSSGTGRST